MNREHGQGLPFFGGARLFFTGLPSGSSLAAAFFLLVVFEMKKKKKLSDGTECTEHPVKSFA